ncbi:FAD/NAD(P)-binding protein [Candidatus Desantisbacteria bacterium]|nr:FAD/NAD(P)-binding protein [Candidatus Desantisbacteria bacterium]
MNNIYIPYLMIIKDIIQETFDVKTFQLEFKNKEDKDKFSFLPGQFCEFSVFGVGESTFCIASSPTRSQYLECSIKKIGKVTGAIHELKKGDVIGLRGPYGKSFPLELIKDKNILFVGGGIGLAPLHSLIDYCLDNRKDYKKIDIIYGSRTPSDLVYTHDFDRWKKANDVNLYITVDRIIGGWAGHVGFVPMYLQELKPSHENTVAITCGPPIMIKFVIETLSNLGFSPDMILTSLEMKMKCGVGKCGRCNIGNTYVCQDGPIFSYEQIKPLPKEF